MACSAAENSPPLALVPFERYMLADDRPDYPMVFTTIVSLAGELQREPFAAALAETLERHPLLRSTLVSGGRGQLQWMPVESPQPRLDWREKSSQVIPPDVLEFGEGIDLQREIGVRAWVRKGEGKSLLLMQFHHACLDGIASLRVIGDLLGAYGRRTAGGGEQPELSDIDPAALARRGQFAPVEATGVERPRDLWTTVREGARMLLCRPAAIPLLRKERLSAAENPFPSIQWHTFNADEFKQLRNAARRMEVSVNDLIMRDLFLFLSDWNRQHAPLRESDWLRVTMPTSLRQANEESMSAANRIGYAFLTRRRRDCRDPQALLEGIRWETERVLKGKLGLEFINGLRTSLRIPFAMRLLATPPRCFSTVVLSNIGDVTRRFVGRFPREAGRVRFGDVTLLGFTGTPPLRPHTRASFFASVLAGELTIAVRCDPLHFTAAETRQVLEGYLRQVTNSAGISDWRLPELPPVGTDTWLSGSSE